MRLTSAFGLSGTGIPMCLLAVVAFLLLSATNLFKMKRDSVRRNRAEKLRVWRKKLKWERESRKN